jgi:hypothetical protein
MRGHEADFIEREVISQQEGCILQQEIHATSKNLGNLRNKGWDRELEGKERGDLPLRRKETSRLR